MEFEFMSADTVLPVSYTHLDYYEVDEADLQEDTE